MGVSLLVWAQAVWQRRPCYCNKLAHPLACIHVGDGVRVRREGVPCSVGGSSRKAQLVPHLWRGSVYGIVAKISSTAPLLLL